MRYVFNFVFIHAGRPKLPDGFEGGTWEKLKTAVVAVQNAQAVGTSLEELYQVRADVLHS